MVKDLVSLSTLHQRGADGDPAVLASRVAFAELAACNRPDDQKRFGTGGHFPWKGGVERIVREILPAGEEAEVGTAAARDVVPDRAAEHRIGQLESVQESTLGQASRGARTPGGHRNLNFAVDVG